MLERIPAPESFIKPPPTLGTFDSVSPNLWVYFGVSNSGVVLTEAGVIVVDGQSSPGAAKTLHESIRRITDKEICYVINTHYHGDHTFGNFFWQELGIPIIGSTATARLMTLREKRMRLFYELKGLPCKGSPLALPSVKFDDELWLNVGGTEFVLKNRGWGETEDSITVWLPQQRVLFANDTVECNGFPIFGMPIMDEGLDGDGRYLSTLANYASLRADTVITGHGHVTDSSSILKMKEIAEFFLASVDKGIAAGKTFNEIYSYVLKSMPKEYTEMPPIWGTVDAAIRRAHYSLGGWFGFAQEAVPVQPVDPIVRDAWLGIATRK